MATAVTKILEFIEREPRCTSEEIMEATGLTWDIILLHLSTLCQNGTIKCLPRSHTKYGLRAEYFLA